MTENTEINSYRASKRRNRVLIGLIAFLILLSVASLGGAFSLYSQRIQDTKLHENRLITMEWGLLRELKLQTDRQLSEKDQEIADLRQQYLNVLKLDRSSSSLRTLSDQLQKAEQERDGILARGYQAPEGDSPMEIPWEKLIGTQSPSRITEILLEKIQILEMKLLERKLYAEVLHKELMSLMQAVNASPSPESLLEPQERLVKALFLMEKNRSEVEKSLRNKAVDLDTWTLLRALISSTPAIKMQYPRLLSDMEKYREDFGEKNRLLGSQKAYTTSLEILRSPTLEPGSPAGN